MDLENFSYGKVLGLVGNLEQIALTGREFVKVTDIFD
jgi:hypothetical protein